MAKQDTRTYLRLLPKVGTGFRPTRTNLLTVATAAVLAISAGVLPARSAVADGLPEQAAPAGFRSVDNAGGGRILAGTLPHAHSALESFHAGLRRLKLYFGSSLQITGAVTSSDNQMRAAFFRAKLHGTPVSGISLISYNSEDLSHEAILFDTAGHFKQSMPSLVESLKTISIPIPPPSSAPADRGAQEGRGAPVPRLTKHMAEDGTVGLSIPDDWQIKLLQSGIGIAFGPGKERVAMNAHFTFLDPNSQRYRNAIGTAQFTHTQPVLPLPVAAFSTNVAQAYINGVGALAQQQHDSDPQVHITMSKPMGQDMVFLSGTKVESGVTMQFAGLVSAQSVGSGAWSLAWWMVFDTPEGMKRSAPTLAAIYLSCLYFRQKDIDVKNAETAKIVGDIQAAMGRSKEEHDAFEQRQQEQFERSQAQAQVARDNMGRTTAGWINYIQGGAVLEHTDTGARGTIDSNLADLIANADPDHFRVVPVKEYRPGVDF